MAEDEVYARALGISATMPDEYPFGFAMYLARCEMEEDNDQTV